MISENKREGKIRMENLAFLRWIGGKSKIVKTLAGYAPRNYDRYWEPFLGGASMFFFS